jgi:uncharacterized membrane protein
LRRSRSRRTGYGCCRERVNLAREKILDFCLHTSIGAVLFAALQRAMIESRPHTHAGIHANLVGTLAVVWLFVVGVEKS